MRNKILRDSSRTSCGQSLDSASGSEGRTVGNTNNRDCDDSVEDGRQDFDAGKSDGDNERRIVRVSTVGVQKVGVACRNDKTEDEETNNVEESDTPEDLLDSLRKSLSGVGGLCSCKTNQLSTTEGEGSGNEDTAEALEAIAEGLTVLPVLHSNVASSVSRDTTDVNHNTEDDETNAGHDLDNRKNELDFSVCSHTKELNCAESNEEDSNPHTNVDVSSSFPEVNSDRSGCKFERKDGQPLNGVLPADSEAPRL